MFLNISIALTILLTCLLFLYLTFGYLQNSRWQTLETSNGNRRYILKSPRNNASKKQKPLLLSLHGYTDKPRLMEFYTGWSRRADRDDFFVVYPEGTQNPEEKKLSWNASSCCNPAVKNDVDDVEFLVTLIEKLSTELPIDTNKIFITGFSNGGKMAQMLAAERPDLITAVGVMSGTAGGSIDFSRADFVNNPTGAVNIVFVHGEEDTGVPIEGGYN